MMIKSKEEIPYIDSEEWQQTTRSLMSSKRKQFRMNFMNNSLSSSVEQEEKDDQKLIQYFDEVQKDNQRYNNIKTNMKKKFFNIRTARQKKLLPRHPPKLLSLEKKPEDIFNKSYLCITDRKLSQKQEVKEQIQNILDYSLNLNRSGIKSQQKNLRTRSELERKNEKMISEQKNMIKRIIRKSQSTRMPDLKWQDLTNKQKFLMDYLTYQKNKTLAGIQKDVFQRKIRKKTKQIEKFQDFILQQVKFSTDHKEKLSRFFSQIRYEFKRVQSYKK